MSDVPHTNGISPFDYQPRQRMVFGQGALEQIGELAEEYGAGRVLIVTDPGIERAGHVARACELLSKVGIPFVVFDGVEENPTTKTVARCLQAAQSEKIDFFIGLGGGSSMDTAKGCNFLLTNGGQMQDYWGKGLAKKSMLPLIAVPTTAGTGSECQSYALIADEHTHAKMACGDPKAAAKVALLDPVLTLSQPKGVAACTAIDTITHAVESAVTSKRNPLSSLYSHESFRLGTEAFPAIIKNPADLEARGKMLLAAAFAGVAIENSMLGAAHSAANPLTAHFNIVHGVAVGLMLPFIIRFNSSEPEADLIYQRLGKSADALIFQTNELLDLAEMPDNLLKAGATSGTIPQLAAEAAQQWTANFNPRKISTPDFEHIYTRAFTSRKLA